MATNAEASFENIAFPGGATNVAVGPTLASAATITPTFAVHHVTGTATITTITVPWAGFTGQITLIPDGLWSLATGGNIKTAFAATVNVPVVIEYDGTSWFISGQSTAGVAGFGQFAPWAQINASIAATQIGIGTLDLTPLVVYTPGQFSSAYIGLSNSYSATNAGSSRGDTVSISFGLWTRSGGSLSLMTSASAVTAFTVTGSSSSASYQGLKLMPIALAANMSPGNYWYGYISSISTAGNAIAGALSNAVQSDAGNKSGYLGVFGSSTFASGAPFIGMGALSVSTAVLPAAIAFSDMVTAGNTGQPMVNFVAYTA